MMVKEDELRVFAAADGAGGFAELNSSPLAKAVTDLVAEAGPTVGQSFTLPALLELLRLKAIQRTAHIAILSLNRAKVVLVYEQCCAGSAALTEMTNNEAALGTILKLAVGEALVEERKPVRCVFGAFSSSSLSFLFLVFPQPNLEPLQELVFKLDASAKKLAELARRLKAADVGLAAEAAGQASNAWLRFVLFVVSHVVVHHDPIAFWQNVAAHLSEPRTLSRPYIAVLVGWFVLGVGALSFVLWARRQRR